MDVSTLASQAVATTTQQTRDAISIAVLKKTLEIQANSATMLMDALAQQAASNPPNLGNNIDTTA